MAISQRTINISLIIALLLGITIAVMAYIRSGKTPPPTPEDPNPKPYGLGGAFASILAQAGGLISNLFTGACDPKREGYTKGGQYKPEKCGYVAIDCDPNRVGFEKDGTPNALCGKDYTGCDYNKCDPNRYGWNECGFLDNRCT